jgi:hypothetical protein
MKTLSLLVTLLASSILASGAVPSKVASKEYVAVSTDSMRVILEAVVTVESKDLISRRTDSLFFVPYFAATKEERSDNRAVVETGFFHPIDGSHSGYMAVGIATQAGLALSLSAFDRKGLRDVSREGSLVIPFGEDTTSDVARIALSIVWKKRPNQALQPTPMSVTPPAAQEPRRP